MGKRLYFNHEARRLLQDGVDELANTVKVTLGPEGPQRRARAARRAADDHQRRRLDRARDRARRTSTATWARSSSARSPTRRRDLTGDGTTTATLLAQAIVREGMRALDEGANPMLLRARHRGGDRGRSSAELRAGRPSRRGPRRAACTSRRSPPRRTAVIGERRRRGAGPRRRRGRRDDRGDRRARASRSTSSRAWWSRTAGCRRTWCATPSGWRRSSRTRYILMTNKPIKHPNDLLPALDVVDEGARARWSSCAENVEGGALGMLVANNQHRTIEAVAARAPGFGHRRIQHLGDLAAFTGGVVIAEEAGLSLAVGQARALRQRAARDRAPPTRRTFIEGGGTPERVAVAPVADPRRARPRGARARHRDHAGADRPAGLQAGRDQGRRADRRRS